MGYLSGLDRSQMGIWSLDDMVLPDSTVRIIDSFVDKIDLTELGFTRTGSKSTGRPGYPADVLVKLYVYGYENGVRSSRKLEVECQRNIEVMWLTGKMTPDYKTISEFRRQNIEPLQKLFRLFVLILRYWDLIEGSMLVIDGTKIKASNNKKKNFSQKKLKRLLAQIDKQIAEWLDTTESNDLAESAASDVTDSLNKILERKEIYEGLLSKLEQLDENEVSLVDPDARLMGNNRGGVDMAYNVQSTADALKDFIVDFDVSKNPSDQGQLDNMTKRLKDQGYSDFTVLADKGYHNGKDLEACEEREILAIVARQSFAGPKGRSSQFHIKCFTYDINTDSYLCPNGATLDAHSAKKTKRRKFYNKQACADCEYLKECVGNDETEYRVIKRDEYADVRDRAEAIYEDNKELYRLRQQKIEHPFGTIKHTMNGGYFLLRTEQKVRCEVALLLLGYNIKRAISVLGFEEIMARIESLPSLLGCLLLHHFEPFTITTRINLLAA